MFCKENYSIVIMPGYNLITEQTRDKELLKLKEKLLSGKASQVINSKYILLDNVHYYLSKAVSDMPLFGSTFLII